MERGLHDITSATTVSLLPIRSGSGDIRSITLANYNNIYSVNVDVFLEDKSGDKAYIVKSLAIPRVSTVRIVDYINFDNSVLALKLTTAGTAGNIELSVIVK